MGSFKLSLGTLQRKEKREKNVRKLVSGLMLILWLLSILSVAVNIEPARSEWTGTIYIRADGRIDPSDAPVITDDNITYTLTDNITSSNSGIIVERDNITINGAGFAVQGIGSFPGIGVKLYHRSNVTIANMTIARFETGISLSESNDCSLFDNILTDCLRGISLFGSANNKLRRNKMRANQHNLVVDGYRFLHFVQDIDTSNTVNEKPIYYLHNKQKMEIPLDAGYVALINCTEITVKNLTLMNNEPGILAVFTKDSLITNNIIMSNSYGISLYNSSNNVIVNNNITANGHVGIYVDGSFNTIKNNIVTHHLSVGISIYSPNNTLIGNIVTNTLEVAINLCSSNNTLYDNVIKDNFCGIDSGSSDNIIYHNNFVNNTQHVYLYDTQTNIWDKGYPSGGNYWSNYTGADLYSGPHQNVTGGDGIGDTFYVINENNTDRYPLMAPFKSFNASLNQIVDIISNSTIEDIQYFESNGTLVMYVSNVTTNQTCGFCRLTIPHNLLPPPYYITVNNIPVDYVTIFENQTLSIIYFTYKHSTLKIVIIPESPPTIMLIALIVSTMPIVILTKRRKKKM